jgi:hypothetical protein
MRLENYEASARRLLERARDTHRGGSRTRATELRLEADGLIAQGAEALRRAQEQIAALATEAAVQAIEDDAYLTRLRRDRVGEGAA